MHWCNLMLGHLHSYQVMKLHFGVFWVFMYFSCLHMMDCWCVDCVCLNICNTCHFPTPSNIFYSHIISYRVLECLECHVTLIVCFPSRWWCAVNVEKNDKFWIRYIIFICAGSGCLVLQTLHKPSTWENKVEVWGKESSHLIFSSSFHSMSPYTSSWFSQVYVWQLCATVFILYLCIILTFFVIVLRPVLQMLYMSSARTQI